MTRRRAGATLVAAPTCGVDDLRPAARPYAAPACLRVGATAADDAVPVRLEEFPVEFDGYTYTGWIAYEAGALPRPQVLVIPNYAGLKQFDKDQAVFLAKCGYVGIAVDMYKVTDDYTVADRSPAQGCSAKEAQAHMTAAFKHVEIFLRDSQRMRDVLGAYLAAGRAHPAVDPRYAAAIGYCFGGTAVIEMVRGGLTPLQAAVSFHGVLQSNPVSRNAVKVPCENRYNTECVLLLESGNHDRLVTEKSYRKFRNEMNNAGVDWRFDNHGSTPHGFALAPWCFNNEYTEAADRRSTLAMLSLFQEVFPRVEQRHVPQNACGTVLGQGIMRAARL